jgi:TRAP-type C4-dicarboxylate transport system substrate-binding protein
MAALPANVQKVIREAAVESVQTEHWNNNLREQEAAWTELAKRAKAANATPDIPSFRTKMGPVLESFAKRGGAKGKTWVEACQAAAKA